MVVSHCKRMITAMLPCIYADHIVGMRVERVLQYGNCDFFKLYLYALIKYIRIHYLIRDNKERERERERKAISDRV